MKKQEFSHCAAIALALLAGIPGALHADITVASAPVGVMTKKLVLGTSGLAFPLIQEDLFVGAVATNTGNVLVFTDTAGDVGALLDAQRPCFAEVATGAFEGERFDVDTAATIAAGDGTLALRLGFGSHSTLATLAADALAGARVIVRPHVRLSDLSAMLASPLVGHNKHNLADGVNVFEGTAYAFYCLRGDGITWGRKDMTGEFSGLVIPPDTSVQVVLRSSARTWLDAGVVRTNAFRKNLVPGSQAFATGFPVALSPVDLGAFANVGAPLGTGWTGNADPETADGIRLSAMKPIAFHWYFLDADGLTWRRVAGKADVTGAPLAGPADALILRRNNPDPDFIILPPFDL